jgi:hypothetical protein
LLTVVPTTDAARPADHPGSPIPAALSQSHEDDQTWRDHWRAGRRDEAGYFYRCPICGQAVDERDLGQVLHHEGATMSRLAVP